MESNEQQPDESRPRSVGICWLIGIATLLLIVGPCTYLYILPYDLLTPTGFSTPEACMKTYYTALRERRWADAAECLSSEYREALKEPIENRRFFDCYGGYGFKTKAVEVIQCGYVTVLSQDDRKATVRISHQHPRVPLKVYNALSMNLCRSSQAMVKENGQWKIGFRAKHPRAADVSDVTPLVKFNSWYERVVPDEARGWAAKNEAR
jgi:hypothetical protein